MLSKVLKAAFYIYIIAVIANTLVTVILPILAPLPIILVVGLVAFWAVPHTIERKRSRASVAQKVNK